MLFNSYVFLLAFLPVTLLGFYLLSAVSMRLARLWVLAASFVFFGWWSVPYLGLLIVLMLFNFGIGRSIAKQRDANARLASALCAFGVTVNLAVLAYYKYSRFVVEGVDALTGLDFAMHAVVLPLGISFYTFQQIAYLVDVKHGKSLRYSLLDYFLFVSYFPQLIAGPIVHHHELIPQLKAERFGRFNHANFAAGTAFVVVGLVKKVVIADSVSQLVPPAYDAELLVVPFADAWLSTLAFGVGLYFDFSGYCDIAVGLARMFGVQLPYNFNSPYRAASIVDFWRRWHITLSRFLRDYLYVPLGGNRKGTGRRYVNLMVTMLLGGLWHGAAWTFVVWGALHGIYLTINHLWNAAKDRAHAAGRTLALNRTLARTLTFLAVMVAWVFFRAPSFERAAQVLEGLFGLSGWISPALAENLRSSVIEHGFLPGIGILDWWMGVYPLLLLIVGTLCVLVLPNSQEFIDGFRERYGDRIAAFRFKPGLASAITAAGAFLLTLLLMTDVKEFVYFQF